MKLKQCVIGLAIGLLVIGTASAESLKGKTVYVSAKSVAIKSSTGFFASTKGTLLYGDQATVVSESGTWVEITSTKGINGWTAASNVTTKRITSTSGTSASASEIALAGKGFSEEVENTYKADGNLNYDGVDVVEGIQVPDEEVQAFIIEGHLAQGGE
ncbi:MAG: SH3 domain-containing protein [Treponema sp.]|jgi:hypothetical protein|nr:SH3 domain-containing protein [Treponema sp.]